MATSISPVFRCHVSHASLLLLCLIISSNQGYAFQGMQLAQSDHYVSLRPSTACKRPTKGYPTLVDDRTTTLEVVHRHGPCSTLKEDPMKLPSFDDGLRQDQLRVDWIHSRLSQESSINGYDVQKKNDPIYIPVYDGIRFRDSYFFTIMEVGSPSVFLTVGFDTSSPLTWTQCEPCSNNCGKGLYPIFNPLKSTSYTNISCSSSVCTSLPSQGVNQGCTNSTSTCTYNITYRDGYRSVGNLSTDRLILGRARRDVVDNFTFGCNEYKNDGFDRIGLIGLGRGNISFIEQTASQYNRVFSYCLPSDYHSLGFLTFGGSPLGFTKVFTPLSNSTSSFYAINMTGISVSGRQLNISSAVFSTGAIIDSGTVITRLPPDAYSAFRKAVRENMLDYNMVVPSPTPLLDTCYRYKFRQINLAPSITFSFTGGANLNVNRLVAVVPYDRYTFCLPFAANSDPNSPAILGSIVQQTNQVIYDVGGGKLGFVNGACK